MARGVVYLPHWFRDQRRRVHVALLRGEEVVTSILVQAVDRALLVDTIPPSEQASGNAWAARMLGVGSVVGFFVCVHQYLHSGHWDRPHISGNINLTRILPFLGESQLGALAVVVSLLLLAGHLTMALLVQERVLLESHSQRCCHPAYIVVPRLI